MIEILRRHSFTIAFLAIFFVSVYVFTDDEETIQRLSGYTMGTTYSVQVVDMPEAVTPDALAQRVGELLTQLDTGIFSTYAADSELSRFNRHPVDAPFNASPAMLEVLQLAQDIAELTDGAFDITVGPLVNLWGFGPEPGAPALVPEQSLIDAALAATGWYNLVLDPDRGEIHKTREIYVDLSGIAKGYAVDRLAAMLDGLGVQNYFLEVGGELKIKGRKPGGISWVPAIEAPRGGAAQIYEIFYNRGETIGVAGSGDYRNYFEVDGVRYSHEIDPRTGRPVQHNLAAVYVIDPATARADALATAFMVLGLDAGRALAEREDLAVYFIYKSTGDQFADHVTSRFSTYLAEED